MKPWFRHYIGATRDPKFKRIAIRTGQRLGDIIFIWDTLEESASEVDDRGIYRVDPADIAYELRCDPSDVAAVLAAFEAPDVRLIGDGVITKWTERQFDSDSSAPRVKEFRDRKRSAAAAGADNAPEDGAGGDAKPAHEQRVTASRRYSNGDVTPSESETDSETESSSVVLPFAPRANAPTGGGTDDDDSLIAKMKKALGDRVALKALRAGIPLVASWIRDGCDLELDVLPELAEIRGKLRTELKTFSAPFVRRQVIARRDERLRGGSEQRAGPAALTVKPATPAKARPPDVASVTPQRRKELAAILKQAAAGLQLGDHARSTELVRATPDEEPRKAQAS